MGELKVQSLICLLLSIIIVNIGFKTNAIELVDINKKASLEINHSYMDRPLTDVKFSIYRVARFNSENKIEITDTFKDYSINFENIKDESEWFKLADTLTSYVMVDNIKADRESTTNSQGNVKFADLNLGIYLVVGETKAIDNNLYKTKPFLVQLPSVDSTNNSYVYDVKVTTKCEEIINSTINLIVEKKWVDNNSDERPESIKVSLYGNGEYYETIALSSKNNWKHEWNNLSNSIEWHIIEDEVPEGYTVVYEKYEDKIVITNTKSENTKLPITGDAWWKLCLTNISGLALIALGYILISKK